MKRLLIFLLLFNNLWAQKINFNERISFDSLIHSKQERLIFIDFYTTWCGPCKRMDKEVFTDSLIISHINSNFISLKIDAEEGEGVFLAKRYNVSSYPTYLFLNSKGIPIYKSVGYMSPVDFINQIKNAIIESKENTTLFELDSLYLENKTNINFLKNYLSRRTKLRLDNSDLLDNYISQLSIDEIKKIETLQLIVDNGNRINKSLQIGLALEVLIDNKELLKSLNNAYPLNYYLENAKRKTLQKAIELKSDSLLSSVLKFTENTDDFDNTYTVKLEYLAGVNELNLFYKESNAFIENRLSSYGLTKLKFIDSIALSEILNSEDFKDSSPEEILEIKNDYKHTQSIRLVRIYNSITDFIIENEANNSQLLKAERWAKKALDICMIDTNYFKYIYPHALNNFAQITYKLKRKEQAVRYQKLAVSLVSKLEDKETLEIYSQKLSLMKKGKSLK